MEVSFLAYRAPSRSLVCSRAYVCEYDFARLNRVHFQLVDVFLYPICVCVCVCYIGYIGYIQVMYSRQLLL